MNLPKLGTWTPGLLLTLEKGTVSPLMTPFIDLNYMIYIFQYDSIYGKFSVTVKADNGKLVINRRPISIFQEQDLPTSNGVKLWMAPLGSCGIVAVGLPRCHLWSYSCCQGCGQGQPWAEWEAPCHDFLCLSPNVLGHGSDLPSGESEKYNDIKKVVRQALEGPQQASWTMLRTLTVIFPIPPEMLGLMLPSTSTTWSSFSGVTMNTLQQQGGWPYGSHRSQGLTASWTTRLRESPRRKEGKGPLAAAELIVLTDSPNKLKLCHP